MTRLSIVSVEWNREFLIKTITFEEDFTNSDKPGAYCPDSWTHLNLSIKSPHFINLIKHLIKCDGDELYDICEFPAKIGTDLAWLLRTSSTADSYSPDLGRWGICTRLTGRSPNRKYDKYSYRVQYKPSAPEQLDKYLDSSSYDLTCLLTHITTDSVILMTLLGKIDTKYHTFSTTYDYTERVYKNIRKVVKFKGNKYPRSMPGCYYKVHVEPLSGITFSSSDQTPDYDLTFNYFATK